MFQSDHTAFPYPNATNLTYVHCDIDTMTMILVPTGNTSVFSFVILNISKNPKKKTLPEKEPIFNYYIFLKTQTIMSTKNSKKKQ